MGEGRSVHISSNRCLVFNAALLQNETAPSLNENMAAVIRFDPRMRHFVAEITLKILRAGWVLSQAVGKWIRTLRRCHRAGACRAKACRAARIAYLRVVARAIRRPRPAPRRRSSSPAARNGLVFC